MKFELYKDIVLIKNIDDKNLKTGDIGTIVEYHSIPDKEPGYSVEFFDLLGNTVAVVTVPESWLRSPTHRDIPSTRNYMKAE